MMNRRTLLVSATASAALAALGITPSVLAASRIKLGEAQPFGFDALIERARALAAKPYAPPPSPPADVLSRIDYDAHGKIRFRTDDALFAKGPGQFPVTFFHLGTYFRTPVRMHVIERGKDGAGRAREIVYDDAYFDMPADSPAHKLPPGSGFAGFRFQESRLGDQKTRDWRKNDWVAFLGASYFRAIGDLYQYGLSARGVAIDVAEAGKPEEFPAFTHFWFETPEGNGDTVTVYALLDGPSICGAYRFVMQRAKAVIMDVECALFLRKDVGRLGLAPLTSMYWFSESIKGITDWRPEVHDSDGLAIWNGAGEHIWRPLNNPPQTTASAFSDDNPKGFGLLQRDRLFDHYQDGVNYEPKGVRKFMVEFKGAPLEKLPFGVKPEAVLTASRGTFSYVFTEAVPNNVPGHWRAQFDLTADGKGPVEIRLFLRLNGKPLSETWLYQYHPPQS
ncbi:Glucans biosynthesis protein D [compost metagenome]